MNIIFTRFVLSIFMVMVAPTAILASPDNIIAYTQSPAHVRVDYSQDQGITVLHLSARPSVMACGRISPLPVRGWLDENVMNVEVADYKIVPPEPGDEKSSCGTAYKTARAEIKIPHALIKAQDIHILRMWYKNRIDTFSMVWDTPSHISLSASGGPRFFAMGFEKINQYKNRE